ncbi:MAG: DUF3500 domain-containing protein, partial [Chitinophaga rupis]
MKHFWLSIFLFYFFTGIASAQELVSKANVFIQLLDSTQRVKTFYPFDDGERYRFNFVPLDDRKGISINELNTRQRTA